MIVDRIDLFEALAQHEIRVARSAYVDSPEDTLAFAARRNAPDQRLVPIHLYGAFSGIGLSSTPAFTESPFTDEQSIPDAYRRLVAKTLAAGGRVLAQETTEAGTDIAIECRIDPALGKVIAVRGGEHQVQHLLPLDVAGASTLAANVQDYAHHGSRTHVRRMVEHVLVRVSLFYEASDIERLELDPVRLHGNTYTVLDATATSNRSLTVKHVDKGSRDRKGHYHPSGRQ